MSRNGNDGTGDSFHFHAPVAAGGPGSEQRRSGYFRLGSLVPFNPVCCVRILFL